MHATIGTRGQLDIISYTRLKRHQDFARGTYILPTPPQAILRSLRLFKT